ncbi:MULTISPECIES: rhomboid family intramembrane serine protease [Arthrobacter]|uniref:Rhomboid family intramembrane serine protease n=2 Tax=Arthrobacter TaxID=1663 RepID=A0ABU9KPV5_9MICC|nr:rhomboid family intramembrane serine protease [Arthrobacter sp. YJM1]MDP5227971.1 rhomboid family intramembrane serine protease [Arthrobacter sp. YJM1]
MSSSLDRQSPARSRFATAAGTIAGFVAVLWAVEIVNTVLGNRLNSFGVRPWRLDGLAGLLFAPLLHNGWGHLISNTGPLLVLGFMILLSGVATWVRVTALVWVSGGIGAWLFGFPGSVHVGASGLVFGWIVYLVLRGVYARKPLQIGVGLLVLLAYGAVLWGVLPGRIGISWQMHLFGALGGGVAAWLEGRRTS